MAGEKENALRALAQAADAIEAARAVPDPGQRAREMDAAYQAAAEAFASLFGEAALQRAAAAWLGHEPADPEGLDPETLADVREGVDHAILANRDTAIGCRNMLARFLLDHAALLPPGLAEQAAMGLYLLNLGEAAPIFKPYKMQGLANLNAARKYFARLGIYSRIYYRVGFYQVSLAEAIAQEEANAPEAEAGKLSVGTMQRYAQRHPKLRQELDWARQKGIQDRLAGRQFEPPIARSYSFEQLRKLEEHGHG